MHMLIHALNPNTERNSLSRAVCRTLAPCARQPTLARTECALTTPTHCAASSCRLIIPVCHRCAACIDARVAAGATIHSMKKEVSSDVSDPKRQDAGRRWWPVVLLFAVCWALAFSVLTACAASANLAGAMLSDDASTSTLPLALTSFTTGAYNIVLPAEFARLGYWGAYLLGGLVGVLGCLLCFAACELGHMYLLCIGAVFIGIAMAHAQNYRFGVVLCVDAAKAPIAISWVLAGGVVGAVLGPVQRLTPMHVHPPMCMHSSMHLLRHVHDVCHRSGVLEAFQGTAPDTLLRSLPDQRLLLLGPQLAPHDQQALATEEALPASYQQQRICRRPAREATRAGLLGAALLGLHLGGSRLLWDDGE